MAYSGPHSCIAVNENIQKLKSFAFMRLRNLLSVSLTRLPWINSGYCKILWILETAYVFEQIFSTLIIDRTHLKQMCTGCKVVLVTETARLP